MKNLWFKQLFVEGILSGEKTDTIRKASSRLPETGECVSFSVGPRPPFALAKIIRRENIASESVTDADRKKLLQDLYGDTPLVRLTFELE